MDSERVQKVKKGADSTKGMVQIAGMNKLEPH